MSTHVPHPIPEEETARHISRDLEEVAFGLDPESRVRELRRSILKEEAGEVGMPGLLTFLNDQRRYREP